MIKKKIYWLVEITDSNFGTLIILPAKKTIENDQIIVC